MNDFRPKYELIVKEIQTALGAMDDKQVETFVDAVLSAEKVFLVGVGRVMLSLQAMTKRLNHLGVRSYCVGDIGEPAITERDLLIVGSGSGESVIPVAIAKVAKKHNAKIAHIGSNPNSSLAPITDVFVRIPVKTKLGLEGEIQSNQPMSSLFEQSLYIFADAVAWLISERKHLDDKELWRYHANLE